MGDSLRDLRLFGQYLAELGTLGERHAPVASPPLPLIIRESMAETNLVVGERSREYLQSRPRT